MLSYTSKSPYLNVGKVPLPPQNAPSTLPRFVLHVPPSVMQPSGARQYSMNTMVSPKRCQANFCRTTKKIWPVPCTVSAPVLKKSRYFQRSMRKTTHPYPFWWVFSHTPTWKTRLTVHTPCTQSTAFKQQYPEQARKHSRRAFLFA